MTTSHDAPRRHSLRSRWAAARRAIVQLPMTIWLTTTLLIALFIAMVLSGALMLVVQWNSGLRIIDQQLRSAQYTWGAQPSELFTTTLQASQGHTPYKQGTHPPNTFYVLMHSHSGVSAIWNDHTSVPDLSSLPSDGVPRTVRSLTPPEDENKATTPFSPWNSVVTLDSRFFGEDFRPRMSSDVKRWRVISYPAQYVIPVSLLPPGKGPISEKTLASPGVVVEKGVCVIALPLEGIYEHLMFSSIMQVFLAILLMTIAGGVVFFIVAAGLAPLSRMEYAAQEIARQHYHYRLPITGPDEVRSLSRTFNTLAEHTEKTIMQYQHTEQQLKQSEDRLRQFVGNASHELRTPLTALRGFADAALMGALPQRAALERITAESTRMQQLVEDLLLLARMESADARAHMEMTEVPLVPLLRDAVSAARISWPQRTIQLTLHDVRQPDDIPDTGEGSANGHSDNSVDNSVVVGNSTQLRQIVDNLINNALLHAGPDATVFVGLRTSADTDEESTGLGGNAYIVVADNGVGMSADTLAHACERFYKGDESRFRDDTDRSHGKGSGLGLSIVKTLVEAHGGTLSFTSRPGEGTHVLVTLPLATEEEGLEN